MLNAFIFLGSLVWIALLFLPWRPWSTRERLEANADFSHGEDFSDVTALIPARDEAAVIVRTLGALATAKNLRVIVIDDQSRDGTDYVARGSAGENLNLEIVRGAPLPQGWAGKLWALEQGRERAHTPLVLLLDADIELAPGMLAALKRKLLGENRDLVSIMAALRMETFWEKLLVPAFVYFFKLIYPFALGNNPRSRLGVAAGGCILLRAAMLEKIGGFGALRGAIIDDCTLAKKIKRAGGNTWIGLSHDVRSHRAYRDLAGIWNMVARSAFTQLRYSAGLLLATTATMLIVFWFPVAGFFLKNILARVTAAAGTLAMLACYLPILRFYKRSPLWLACLPLTGALFLAMTWTSALRYWRGCRSEWKGRVYRA